MAEIIGMYRLQKGVSDRMLLDTKTRPEEKASEILCEYTVKEEAINPVLIAEKLGVNVVNAEFTDASYSGALQVDKSNIATIYVKHDDTPERKRFTIAHELGHYLLHKDNRKDFIDNEETVFFRSGESNSQLEREANDFAANLLMPRERVLRKWEESADIDLLRRYFGVSTLAMKFRLKNLGLIFG
ncbi:ImmA/IrrE family metallo-endopeptidase [Bacillus vallismortis]|uniref:ImmA/IrrE family metallo-endopeptidase n=1 Tax=Bacillus vallismortis TaxID=72361 RepID=UPI002DBB9DBD|nr:ImmA/IrrE family metallo-endopeptidase [Bacillus vallismortis]MEC1792200.1 ImmA/IrrE family metallo-endopeptidase [Bacillus vallismortis]